MLGALLVGVSETGKPLNHYLMVMTLMVFSALTLALPYIVGAVNEKIMYIFGVVNVISIPVGKLAKKA